MLLMEQGEVAGWEVQQQGTAESCKNPPVQRAWEDRLAMPDQRPFKSKFLTRSPGGSAQGWATGVESAWHDNQTRSLD